MNKINRKRRINKGHFLGLIILSIMLIVTIKDLSNLLKIPGSEWNNLILFFAQSTFGLIIVIAFCMGKIKLFKEK